MAAGDIAKTVEGVKSVKNDLQVVAPAARKAVQANDKQITKAVETSLEQGRAAEEDRRPHRRAGSWC